MSNPEVLRKRLETGELDVARLCVAAYLGHPQARAALGAEAPPAVGAEDADAWVRGWFPWVRPVFSAALTRLHVAAGRAALPRWEQALPGDRRPHAALEAAEVWIVQPGAQTARVAREATEGLIALVAPVAAGGDLLLHALTSAPEPERSIFRATATNGALAAAVLAAGAGSFPSIDPKGFAGNVPRETGIGMELALNCLPPQPTYGELWSSWLEAARAELIPWALGEGDPVRDRRGS